MYKKSQTDFAKDISVTRSAVCKMESGENSPSDQTISLISRTFSINEHWIRTGEGEMKMKLSRNKEIADFADNLMFEVDDSFKKRFIIALSKLSEKDWETIEKIADALKEE